MKLHELAKQMESRGRHGDTMLMHVNPTELQVLEAMFGRTTTNPETGLPEAFSWKKLLAGLGMIGGAAAIAFTGGAAAPLLVPMLTSMGIGTSVSSAFGGGKEKSTASSAGEYLDSRTADKKKDHYKFAPPMTMLQSINDRPDLLGRQTNYYAPRISPMGQGFPGDLDQIQSSVGGFAEGGQMTESQAKKTVLAMLAQMQDQQGQQPQQPMAHGRMVQGGGTGLSDSIPARLSVDEYVIPADVVSMMGDGSSQAGGKRLDALVSQVRKSKTGTKKQARPLGRM